MPFHHRTRVSNSEIECLAGTVIEHTLLLVEDKGVWRPLGGGPFDIDDSAGIQRSWNLCVMREGMTIPDWIPIRKKLWDACRPWTEGLTALFGCVQDELFSQWKALPPDGKAWELKWKSERSEYGNVAVPEQRKDIPAPAAHACTVAPGVAQVSLADLNMPVGRTLKQTRSVLLKLGAPARKLKDPRILEAADYKIKYPKSTYKEVSIRFFRTPGRADSIRSWVNKRKSSDHRN